MSYIMIEDCQLDRTLADIVDPVDIEEADVHFNYLANSLGVYTSQIKTNPFPTECKRVLRFWVYIQVCKRKIGENINRTQDGYEQDWYVKKLAEYQKLYDEEKAALTPNKIMGLALDNFNSNQKRSNTIERA